MRLSIFLLICSLSVILALHRGGATRRGFGGVRTAHSAPRFHAPIKTSFSRPPARTHIAKPISRPIRPQIAKPLPKIVPVKPQIAKPVPKVLPKPVIKHVNLSPPKPIKVNPKPQITPVKAKNPAPNVKPPTKLVVPAAPIKANIPKPPAKVKAPITKAAPPKTVAKPPPKINPVQVGASKKVEPKTTITTSATSSKSQGTTVNVKAEQKLAQSINGHHSLTASTDVSKQLSGPNGSGKPQVTSGLEYNYNSPKTQISASANGRSKNGVNVNLQGQQNVFTSKNEHHSLDVSAGASKQIGGPNGKSKPDMHIGAEYNYKTPKTQITASGIAKPGQGVDLSLQGQQNLFQSKNGRHSIDLNAGVSKNVGSPLGNSKPDVTVGGQYSYTNDKAQITTSIQGGPHKGADIGLDAKYNILNNQNKHGSTSLDIKAGVSQHIGGPNGNGKPDAQVGIEFSKKF